MLSIDYFDNFNPLGKNKTIFKYVHPVTFAPLPHQMMISEHFRLVGCVKD